MSAARASLHAVLMAAMMSVLKGQGTYMVVSQYADMNCTVPTLPPFAMSMDMVPFPDDFPIAEALRSGCAAVPAEGVYMSVSGCTVTYYMDEGCGGDPVFVTDLVGGEDGPQCSVQDEGGSSLSQCVSSIPPGVVDASTCLTRMPNMSVSEGCEECYPPQPPSTCGEALSIVEGCTSQCTDTETQSYLNQLTLMFGCECVGGGGGGGEHPTCGEVKAAYKENQCCGNPAKHFHMPARRRLASGPAPRKAPARKAWPARKTKLSRWPLPAVRRLSPAIAARASGATAAAARRAGSMDPSGHALRAMRMVLDGVRVRHGAAAAKVLAAKAQALMDSY